MGIFERLTEEKRTSLANPAEWLIHGIGHSPSAAGVDVTTDEALSSTAVWAAVRLMSETVGSVPLHLYETDGRKRVQARGHPTFELLYRSPNPELTSFELREMLQASAMVSGDAYAEIVWVGGYPKELWPLWSDRMRVERRDGRKRYIYRIDNSREVVLPPRNVLHISGFRLGGLVGINPIQQTQDAIGLARAQEQFGGRFYSNGASAGVVLTHPGSLTPGARKNLSDSIKEQVGGLDRSHRLLILEEGLKWEQRGVSPEQSQAIESRKFQVGEVARIFNIPPHLLKDLERATFSNIEQQSIEFVVYSVRPWVVRWEQRLEKQLLTEGDRAAHFIRFNLEGLLRGDQATRYNAYSVGRRHGWLSVNDVRELEDLNPVEIDGADDYHIQRDLVAIDLSRETALPIAPPTAPRALLAGSEQRSERESRAAKQRSRDQQAQVHIMRDIAQRVLNREVNAVKRQAGKMIRQRDGQSFRMWLDEFYAEQPALVAESFLPALRTYSELVGAAVGDEIGAEFAGGADFERFVQEYADTMGVRWSSSSKGQLLEILRDTDPEEVEAVIMQRMDDWAADRAEKIATKESNQAGNAFAKAAYTFLGVLTLRWVTQGDSCPYCKRLNGRTVEVQGFFLDAGSVVEGDGDHPQMTVRQKLGHPPLHRGCDCLVMAA